jgi:hypothetical protein
MKTRRKSFGRPIVFVHLYKTAGTTLETIIERLYPASRITRFGSIAEAEEKLLAFSRLPELERKNMQVFMGHCHFRQHNLFPENGAFITMVRHPVDRIISEFYFILESPDHPQRQILLDKNMDLAAFVKSGFRESLNNYQTKYLSTLRCPEPEGYYPEVLKNAQQNATEKFELIGLTERFDESILLFMHHFGWKMPYYVKSRVTRIRPRMEDIPDRILELIHETNRMDVELYDFAKRQFEQVVRNHLQMFNREVKLFKLLNSYFPEINETVTSHTSEEVVEVILILQALNDLIRQRRIGKIELLIEYGRLKYPDSKELEIAFDRLQPELRRLQKLASMTQSLKKDSLLVPHRGLQLDR